MLLNTITSSPVCTYTVLCCNTMPFGLVSAWNKRRRSKSEDQINPCNIYFLFWSIQLCGFIAWDFGFNILFFFFQGHTNLWNSGKSNTENHQQRDEMHQPYIRSKKWKTQHVLSVMRIFLGREDSVEYIKAL